MRDDQLLQDLSSKPYAQEITERLQKNNIATYSQLFSALKNDKTDPKTIYDGCYALFYLSDQLDKRKAIPPLLAALKSSDDNARSAAALALGHLNSKRAVLPLIALLSDQSQSWHVRHRFIDALASISDKRALPLFWQIIDDPNEHVELRSRAIEMLFEDPDPINKFAELLRNSIPDIRFWAAYKLACTFYDPTPALSELDRIVAYDHTLPITWGWHVDREAIYPLETIYYYALTVAKEDKNGSHFNREGTYFISPAPEYMTLSWRYRTTEDDQTHTTAPLPEIKLRIDPNWLAGKLHEQWPEIKLNVREPRPEAYLLDWHLRIDNRDMIGGLHRDQYGLVITGRRDQIISFAAWYRSLFTEKQPLYLYQWADAHVRLKAGMTAEQIEKALNRLSYGEKLKTEKLTFV